MSEGPLVKVNHELLQASLAEAREIELGEYNTEQLGWLEANSRPAYIAINAIKDLGLNEEEPIARLGLSLGTSVVRKHIDAGHIDLAEVTANHAQHYPDKKLVDGGEIDKDRLPVLFGAEVGSTLAELNHPRVRTMSTIMLITSLSSEATPETKKFIKLPRPLQRKSGRSVRVTGQSR